MQLSRSARIALRVAAGVGFAFIYVPLALVLVNSFNPDRSASWPPSGLTFRWWSVAWENEGARAALWVSVKAGLGATAIALVLGTLIAFAVARHRFFGRDAISFVVVLPIALPGIVTGIALNSAFSTVFEPLGVGLGLFTVIVGHATFCIVVVFNNVVARLRRTWLVTRKRRWIWARTPSGPSPTSPFRWCARPCWRGDCSPSRSPSTRSW